MIETLVAHVAAENARVGRETSDADAEMIVDGHDLLLMGAELGRGSLERNQDHVCLRLDAHRGRALLHRFHGVLDLIDTTLRTPHAHVTVILISKLRSNI